LGVLAWVRWAPHAGVPAPAEMTPAAAGADAGADRLEQAFERRSSGVTVEVMGQVTRVLGDDESGIRHQRFLLLVPGGHTLLVAHNIDLAPRVPVTPGATVSVRGEY